MDVAGHVWQTSALCLWLKKPKKIIQAVVWGVVPDIIAFTPYAWDFVFGRFLNISGEDLNRYLGWAYPAGHGLPVFLAVFFLVAAARYAYWASLGDGKFDTENEKHNWFRFFHLPMVGWGIHIILDSVSHRKFATPVIWPLSDAKWPGLFDYSNNFTYTLVNSVLYVVFFAILAVFYFRRKSEKTR